MTIKTFTLTILAASMVAPATLYASNVHPIVDFQAGYLLGGAGKGIWMKTESLTKSKTLPGQQNYRVYAPNRYLGELSGSKATSMDVPCPETQLVEFSPASKSAKFKSGVIAIAGKWNAIPRLARQESTAQPVYRDVVAKFLKTKGIAQPTVRIAQILRVDLDNDGADEVLINATNHQNSNGLSGNISPNSRAGEYSMILMRKIVKGKVQTSLIEGDFYPKAKTFNAPSVHKILGTFDVNGDGRMEIVTAGRYYEGDWTTVYTVDGNKLSSYLRVNKTLSEGCGV